ncbi:putative nADPH-ferredoxin reductase fprA [Mycobacterium kansasii]|uniref:Putative nADPH-ferredoxin reductase fprA n=1 Tax=Mycobacterium kansasii TaxID=1768 RepID=A0A1V3WVR4_MYCKA|nr:putative nADPH-ferredoxin reductase fprA [Mycobacterium kansasii]
MGLAGTGTATELVAWINGHPEFVDFPVDLGHERVVIIGNGNVALDLARVLTADPGPGPNRHRRSCAAGVPRLGGP